MRPKPLAALAAVAAVLALLAWGLATKGEAKLVVGQPVPDREHPRLDGRGSGRIADYRGSWVLVNFWASWCVPCRSEAPALQRLHERYADRGLAILGINSEDLTGDARAFVREFGLSYPNLRDREGRHKKELGMTGFPESFLVDPEGRLALIRRGPVDGPYLERFVVPLVEGEIEPLTGEAG